MDRNKTLDHLERALIAGLINRRTFIVGAMATGLLLSSAVPALADELDAMREVQARNLRSLKRSYDYIVVGAGSAGCALVGTLAKREPSAQILLIEAGAWDTASTPPSGRVRSRPTSTTGPRRPVTPAGATSTGSGSSRASRTGTAPRIPPSAARAARSGSSLQPTRCPWRPPA
jgi:hypothetical protein